MPLYVATALISLNFERAILRLPTFWQITPYH